MPGVEIRFVLPPTAARKALDGTAKDGHRQPAHGHHFDRVMQAALDRGSHKSADAGLSRREQPPAARDGTSKSGGKISGEASDGAENDAIGANEKKTPDLCAPSLATESAEPLPIPLPLFLSGSTSSRVDNLPPEAAMGAAGISPAAFPTQNSTQVVKAEMGISAIGQGSADSANLAPEKLSPAATLFGGSVTETSKAVSPDNQMGQPVAKKTHEQDAGAAVADAATKSSPANLPVASILPTDADLAPGKHEILATMALLNSEVPAADPSGSETQSLRAGMESGASAAPTGTGVATTASSMKNPQKTNKVAGLDVKVLPVDENETTREKNLPPQPLLARAMSAVDGRSANLNFSFSSGNGFAPATQNAPTINVLDLPSLADARMRAVERTHDMVALHAMRLVESKSDTLSVVIKPAVGTELSLELRQRDGGVEAQVTVTRGDHQFLSAHWSELQQRLEQRGIKLAPLGDETNFSANDNGDFKQQQTSEEDAAQQASAFAEFAWAGSPGGATARRSPIHEGWETWA